MKQNQILNIYSILCIGVLLVSLSLFPVDTFAIQGGAEQSDPSEESSTTENPEEETAPTEEGDEEEAAGEEEESSDTPSTESTQSTTGTGSGRSEESVVTYDSFTNFPGIGRISNLCQLTQALWFLGFIILFFSVIGSILYGGFIYTSAGVNAAQVNQAKEVIQNAFIGLILGLSVFIILQTIDPNLLSGNCEIESIDPFSYSAPTLRSGEVGSAVGNGDRTLLEVARLNSVGKNPDGRCYSHVANYIDQAGFCGIPAGGFNSAVPGNYHALAKQFAEYMNQGDNAAQWGIRRLNIDNPYNAPAGAIVVVAPQSPGTAHPTAGDITVADGRGNFYNGGEMGYGGSSLWPPGQGGVLGVYVCN